MRNGLIGAGSGCLSGLLNGFFDRILHGRAHLFNVNMQYDPGVNDLKCNRGT